MNAHNLYTISSQQSLPPAEDNSDRNLPPSQTTLDASVVFVEVVESMPTLGVRQKLDAAKSHFEQATASVQNDVKPRVEQAIQLLVEIDNQQGWQELGYNSMRQMIQSELKPLLNLSISQTYRRLNTARVRQNISPVCDNIDDIPDTQLEALSKLPSEQWQDAWTEIVATAPNDLVTAKHVKSVVARRLQMASNELPQPQQSLQTSFTYSYEVGQLVLIQCEDSAAGEQCRRYSGCWGIVHDVYESTAVVAVGGEMVKYLLCDLQPIENSSTVLREVCARVARLWQVPNLPQSAQHLLETFYQRRLDFSQSDLNVLVAIESCLGKA
jgi:ribosomal protein L21E